MLDLAISALIFQGVGTVLFIIGAALLSCLPSRGDALYRRP